MGDVGAAYEGCRRRMTELVVGLDEASADAVVPACPEWTVRDLVAHVAGVVDDVMAGRLEGGGTDAWTAAQVDARRGRPLAALLDEWAGSAPAFAGMLDDLGMPGRQAVFDVVTHEHDLRAALGRAGARDSDAVSVGLSFLGPALTGAAAERGVAVRLEADGQVWGPEEADAVLRASAFEMLRAGTGRRSEAQLRALAWEGAVDRALPAFTFGPFRPCADPLVE